MLVFFMPKKIFLWLITITTFFAFFGGAFSLGLTPSYLEYMFKPNLSSDLVFRAINNGSNDIEVEISFVGDLAQYFSTNEKTFALKSGEEKPFIVSMRLPDSIGGAGKYKSAVRVSELPYKTPSSSTATALVAISAPVLVIVPCERKCADLSIDYDDIDLETAIAKGGITFNLRLFNRGKLDFDALPKIEIYKEGKLFESFFGKKIFLAKEENIPFTLTWWFKDKKPDVGEYLVKASADFGGDAPATVERKIYLGNKIKVENIEGSGKAGEDVYKTRVLLRNISGSPVSVNFKGRLLKDKIVLGESAEQTLKISALNVASASLFIEGVRNVGAGKYVLEIVLSYEGKEVSQKFDFNVVSETVEFSLGGIALIIILILIFAGVLLIRFKKK